MYSPSLSIPLCRVFLFLGSLFSASEQCSQNALNFIYFVYKKKFLNLFVGNKKNVLTFVAENNGQTQ